MLDPKAKFAMKSVTRESIAYNLSKYHDSLNVPNGIQADDPRLTDEFCTQYAISLGGLLAVGARLVSELREFHREQWVKLNQTPEAARTTDSPASPLDQAYMERMRQAAAVCDSAVVAPAVTLDIQRNREEDRERRMYGSYNRKCQGRNGNCQQLIHVSNPTELCSECYQEERRRKGLI